MLAAARRRPVDAAARQETRMFVHETG